MGPGQAKGAQQNQSLKRPNQSREEEGKRKKGEKGRGEGEKATPRGKKKNRPDRVTGVTVRILPGGLRQWGNEKEPNPAKEQPGYIAKRDSRPGS